MATLNLPAKMDFTMGSTEQKMDMTLDDIIKQNRKTKTQRVPIKGRFKNGNGPGQKSAKTPAAKAALQRSVAARSSNLRQGKIAEVRARNGAGTFAATQAAGKRAFATPVTARNGVWMKSSNVGRNNFIGQRLGPGQKRNTFPAAPGNMKISVVNNGSKVGGQRFNAQPFRKRNGPNVPARQVLTGQQLNTDRMDVDTVHPQIQKQKARTLDSLFAEIKERRFTQPAVVQPFTSVGTGRRGGRGGFQGRRRQAQ
ncbi:unnamed protein product [Calypogeia fissa]